MSSLEHRSFLLRLFDNLPIRVLPDDHAVAKFPVVASADADVVAIA